MLVSESPDAAPVPRRRFEWIRAATDRVPTRWFAGLATAAFLAATAAFGGLATAAPPELAQLEPGDAHVTDQRSLTVKRAVLIDELPGSGVFPEEGQRVLALVVDVENTWDEPQGSFGKESIGDSFTIEGVDAEADSSVARLDDATTSPELQPGVPAELVYTWAVDADDYAEGDELTVTLQELSLYTGSFVMNGQWWTDPVPDATVTLEIEDVGAGAEPEEAGDDG
ncbi:hypothetical protein HF576_06105 [Microbacterium sp. CFH 90308]|uniref:DUF4352 domain-containing protein n=1 Tax=Microbacterium salsuginis TaxID=2722803 RepID=A0ABX1KBH8_9MICO|nr:hypothetical protein [Microbacterium sp. CFH 90308]